MKGIEGNLFFNPFRGANVIESHSHVPLAPEKGSQNGRNHSQHVFEKPRKIVGHLWKMMAHNDDKLGIFPSMAL